MRDSKLNWDNEVGDSKVHGVNTDKNGVMTQLHSIKASDLGKAKEFMSKFDGEPYNVLSAGKTRKVLPCHHAYIGTTNYVKWEGQVAPQIKVRSKIYCFMSVIS